MTRLIKTPYKKPVTKQKKRFVTLRAAGKLFKGFILLLGVMSFISLCSFVVFAASGLYKDVTPLPDQMIITLSMNGDFPALKTGPDFTTLFEEKNQTIQNVIDGLDRATKDPRVSALHVKLYPGAYSYVQMERLREAVERFKDSGKKTTIYTDNFIDTPSYYLASAFNEIWMHPMGQFMAGGVAIETPFARSTLDKLGVQPQFERRKEYKSVMESFTNNEISEENRMVLQDLVDTLGAYVSDVIADERGIAVQQLKRLIDNAPFQAEQAKAAGLIDLIGVDFMLEETHLDAEIAMISLRKFVRRDNQINPTHKNTINAKTNIGIVHISGALVDPHMISTAPMAFLGSDIINAQEYAETILALGDEDSIEAVIIHMNSPGGSPLASETLRLAIADVAMDKPVWVVMGDVAASGGYWAAMGASKIFASPHTLTGSIGVAGGKISLQDLWQKIGVEWEVLQYGDNATMYSLNRPFNDEQMRALNQTLDHIYDRFLAVVAQGRAMKLDDVDAVARGRVWSGVQAQQNGLVDNIGTLDSAIIAMAQTLNPENGRDNVNILNFPQPPSPFEQLEGLLQFENPLSSSKIRSTAHHLQKLTTTPATMMPVMMVY